MGAIKQRALQALLALQRFSWEQGAAVQAALECGEDQLLAQLVKAAVFRSRADGRPAQMGEEGSVTDSCCVGEGLVYLDAQAGKREQERHLDGQVGKSERELYQDALRTLLDWALHRAPRSENGIVYHLISAKEFWVDSMYMLPPFLAAAGYYQEALDQLWGYIEALYDQEKGLFHHRWDEEKQVFANANFWGVGNGWALAGIARVIDLLPDEWEMEKKRLIDFQKKLLEQVTAYLLPSGRFHNILDDAESFEEVNLSQMTAYTIYRGVRSGWLKETEKYLEMAKRMRNAALSEVDADGFVHNVCGMPNFDRPGVAPEGQAFLVLMEDAYERFCLERE